LAWLGPGALGLAHPIDTIMYLRVEFIEVDEYSISGPIG